MRIIWTLCILHEDFGEPNLLEKADSLYSQISHVEYELSLLTVLVSSFIMRDERSNILYQLNVPLI